MRRIRTLALLALLALPACKSGSSDDAAANPAGEAPAATDEAEAAPVAQGVPCELATANPQIQNLRIDSADGKCRLFVPSAPAVGSYAIRVSAAGDDEAAAMEVATEGGTLFMTGGIVTIESTDGGRLVGTISAEDATPPGTGRVETRFDVPLPGG